MQYSQQTKLGSVKKQGGEFFQPINYYQAVAVNYTIKVSFRSLEKSKGKSV